MTLNSIRKALLKQRVQYEKILLASLKPKETSWETIAYSLLRACQERISLGEYYFDDDCLTRFAMGEQLYAEFMGWA